MLCFFVVFDFIVTYTAKMHFTLVFFLCFLAFFGFLYLFVSFFFSGINLVSFFCFIFLPVFFFFLLI